MPYPLPRTERPIVIVGAGGIVRDAHLPAYRLAGFRVHGICDLAQGDRKFSGNAQQRKRDHLLHHGTLLFDFDATLVERYLKLPPRQPEYRAGRPHSAFLCNLSFTAAELKQRLRHVWTADEETTDWPRDLVDQLCAEKYDRADWTRRC